MNGMRFNMNANQVCQKKAFSDSESSPFSGCKSPKYHESDVPKKTFEGAKLYFNKFI